MAQDGLSQASLLPLPPEAAEKHLPQATEVDSPAMRRMPLASLTAAEPQANSGTKSLSEERTR